MFSIVAISLLSIEVFDFAVDAVFKRAQTLFIHLFSAPVLLFFLIVKVLAAATRPTRRTITITRLLTQYIVIHAHVFPIEFILSESKFKERVHYHLRVA